IGAGDGNTQAAAAQTQSTAERFTPSSVPAQEQHSEEQGFKTQVPAYAARIEQPRAETQTNAQPAIPWPAMGNATTQTTGHYTPQYGDALDLLKGTSLVSGSGGPDAAPAYRRTTTAPIDTGTDASADDFAQSQRLEPPHAEVRPDLAFATPQQQENAARVAEEAHRAELARQEEARLEWDRQFQAQQAQAEELRLAQLAQVEAQLAQSQQSQQASEPGPELESTLMSRRQRREKSDPMPPAPTADPSRDDDRHDDVWAGPEDRRAEVTPQWSTVGSARAAE